MSDATLVSRLPLEPGCASVQVAVLLGCLSDLHAQLDAIAAELTRTQFAWQPGERAPGAAGTGRNTLGMLFAHIAVAETHIGQVGLRAEPAGHVQDVLGIQEDDDGLPLAAGAAAPTVLADRDADFFRDLLARAIAHTRSVARPLTDADLDCDVLRPRRPDGTQRALQKRWALFHIVEHTAQHLGQITHLRNQAHAAGIV